MISAAFESLEGHRTVVVRWRPPVPPHAQVLFVPAFGDEMSQTRRMMRLVAEALVERGIASTLFDAHGTGDSSADFADASIERWLVDYETVLSRMRADCAAPVLLFGCRLGVALAAELTHRSPVPVLALIGWAPVLQGRMQLSALLRASKIAQGRRTGAAGNDPKAQWAEGRIAFLGGYPISPELASGLERLDAGSRAPSVASATLIDVRPPLGEGGVQPSAALLNHARAWRERGLDVDVLAVEGAPFWNVPDLVDLPSLVSVTVEAVERRVAIPASR